MLQHVDEPLFLRPAARYISPHVIESKRKDPHLWISLLHETVTVYNRGKLETLAKKLMRNTNRCSGDALKEWIDKKNISYYKFAKMLGIEYVHLWRIMSSRNRPGWTTLLMIAKIT